VPFPASRCGPQRRDRLRDVLLSIWTTDDKALSGGCWKARGNGSTVWVALEAGLLQRRSEVAASELGRLGSECLKRREFAPDPNTAVPNWAPGDTIPLGPARGTLRVVEIRPGVGSNDDAVLVVRPD
jgi:hypothetical protein